MSKLTSRSWWSSLGLGKRAADDGDDFGDMGTAFGLDASFDSPATLPPGHTLPPVALSPLESRLIRRSGL